LSSFLPSLPRSGKTVPCPHCGTPLDQIKCPNPEDKKKPFLIAEPCNCAEARRARGIRDDAKEVEADAALTESTKQIRLRFCGVEEKCRNAVPYDIFAQYAYSFSTHRTNGTGLYLLGKGGSGKTWAASAIVLYLAPDWDVQMVVSVDLMREISSTRNTRISEDEVIAKYVSYDLLVIDDIGKESANEWSLKQLYSVVNGRYAQKKPTIFTTQLSGAEIIARWDAIGGGRTGRDILSRLCESGLRVDMTDVDRRAL
jgi:hypothetical protein